MPTSLHFGTFLEHGLESRELHNHCHLTVKGVRKMYHQGGEIVCHHGVYGETAAVARTAEVEHEVEIDG
jgi:hypothetical protein